jgi:uncharacterized membrane protein
MQTNPEFSSILIGITLVLWIGPLILSSWNFSRKGYSPLWGLFGIFFAVGCIVLVISFLVEQRLPCSRCGRTCRATSRSALTVRRRSRVSVHPQLSGLGTPLGLRPLLNRTKPL